MDDSLKPKDFRELVQRVTTRCRDTCSQHAAELLGEQDKSSNVIPKASQIELKQLSSRLTSAIDSVASVTKDQGLQETAFSGPDDNQLLALSKAQAEALESEIKELAVLVKQRRTKCPLRLDTRAMLESPLSAVSAASAAVPGLPAETGMFRSALHVSARQLRTAIGGAARLSSSHVGRLPLPASVVPLSATRLPLHPLPLLSRASPSALSASARRFPSRLSPPYGAGRARSVAAASAAADGSDAAPAVAVAADEAERVSGAGAADGSVPAEGGAKAKGGKKGARKGGNGATSGATAGSGGESAGEDDVEVELPREPLPTNESSEKLLRIRHTSAHVMAMAVQRLFPKAQVTIGPWIQNGFYYDFDLDQPLTDKDLKKIKKEMDKIIFKNLPLRREEVSREEAARRIREMNEPYKLELLDSIKTEPITIYHIGDEWWDLCAGPHVESTGKLPRRAIELQSVAGAYWRGDETRAMLQRIYGTAWESEAQLLQYRQQVEEAKRRDHRRLGKELGLFSIQEDAGGGLVFWHPRGARVRAMIEEHWRKEHLRQGYELLYTPHMAKLDLWKTSGHYEFYRENMFDQMEVEEEHYQIRPMNCPFHIMLYNDSLHSYRDLPIRWAELGTVYRYERSGTMHGLFRVRGFTQDDAHIFCLPSQIRDEIRGVLDLTEAMLTDFGFQQLEINLSTRPEKSVGDDAIWEQATQALREALQDKGWDYTVDEGGGAFYGPKIDVKIMDAIGRKWQCSTIQVDFNLPHRFNMVYADADGTRRPPIMIHRAIFGSLERFFGILIENYAGDFPLWFAPTQLRLLPVTDSEVPFCKEVVATLLERGIRAEVASGERLGKLIRNAETQKIPVMAVVGPREVESRSLNVRTRKGAELGVLSVDQVARKIEEAVANKVTMSLETYWENFQQAFWQISPYAYAAIGIAISIGVSVLGAAWGILITGSSLIGAAIKAPRITSKNLISVIFCEAVAIYGVIVAIILQTKLESVGKARLHSPEALRSGYAIFNSGIIVGLANLFCG
ncbi:unnamed protein product, partial [Closterium sp. NIES-65]